MRRLLVLALLTALGVLAGCSSSTTPWAESLSWTGTIKGSLTDAYGTCYQRVNDAVYLHNANNRIEVEIPRHGPGVVAQDPDKLDGSLTLYLSGKGVYEGTSGSVTYGPEGKSGSVDAWLSPQLPNSVGRPSLHLMGRWRCG